MNAAPHMSRILVLTSTAALGLVSPALAHPGHMSVFRSGLLHYLASLDHLLPAVIAGLCAVLLLSYRRRLRLGRSQRTRPVTPAPPGLRPPPPR